MQFDGYSLQPADISGIFEPGETQMRLSMLIVMAVRLVGHMVFCQGADALSISWEDLKNVAANRPVFIEVAKLHTLRGTILEQSSALLLLAVEGSKPGGMYGKYANVPVKREDVSRIRVMKDPKRRIGRIAGGAVGYVSGTWLGALVGGGENPLTILAGMVGGVTVGYVAGRSFDEALLEITILDQFAPRQPARLPQARAVPEYLRAPALTMEYSTYGSR